MTTPDRDARQTALAIVRLAAVSRQAEDRTTRYDAFRDMRMLYRSTDDTETLAYALANIACRALEDSAERLGLDVVDVLSGLCLIEANEPTP
jgi:hypothetical protein